MNTLLRIVAVAVSVWGGLSTALANNRLYDWQPCPGLLTDSQGEAPLKNWDLTVSPYTHHWTPSKEHKNVQLLALDRRTQGNGFCGLAVFTNSFGQPSLYAYAGQQWNGILQSPRLFTKVSFGLIHGYKGKHKNAIGANQLGVAPAIIPSLGYAFTPQDSAQVFLLGTAGVLIAYVRGF
jgi:hypothetical protein